MTREGTEPDTEQLVADAARARSRVAVDVAELAAALQPAHLKHRALDAAERSVQSMARRALGRVNAVPAALQAYARRHPALAVTLGVGLVGIICWRTLSRRSGRAGRHA